MVYLAPPARATKQEVPPALMALLVMVLAFVLQDGRVHCAAFVMNSTSALHVSSVRAMLMELRHALMG